MRKLMRGMVGVLALCVGIVAAAVPEEGVWNPGALASLTEEVLAAPAEALPLLDLAGLERALAIGDAAAVDRTATALA